MDDDQLPGETGAVESEQSEVDWQQRWKDTHTNWNNLNERFMRFEKDPNALIEFIQDKHPDLLAEDDEEEDTTPADDDFVDPRDQELAELRKQVGQVTTWQQDVESERGERRFANDLAKELGDEQVTDRQRTWIKDRTTMLGNNAKALKEAVDDFRELQKEIASANLERVTQSKKAPHVTSAGKPGTQVPDLDDRKEREAWMRQRMREAEAS